MNTLHRLRFAVLSAVIACCTSQADAAQKPNIILVMPDDVGYGDYACLGNPVIRTPSLDAFKKQSLLFRQFHVSSTCSPCRSALMSGRHEFKNGVTHIFALAGETAPPMDGKNLLPLLADPAGKVRDALPLFNLWGIASAQSMAVVTPEWWYYGEGIKPTEELFHLAKDRYEMTNSAADPKHADTLAAMRKNYDAETALIAPNLAPGHDYENYPTLFSRTIPWEQKAGLLKGRKAQASEGAGEPAVHPKKKRKAKE